VNSDRTGSAQITLSNAAGTNLTLPFSLLTTPSGDAAGLQGSTAPATPADLNIESVSLRGASDSVSSIVGSGEALNQ
jgi:hypothetical protein